MNIVVAAPYFSILALILAFAVDSLAGEYPAKIHPVIWIGYVISELDGYFRKIGGLIGGTLFVITVELIFMIILYAVLHLVSFSFVLELMITAFFLKATFSIRGMRRHIVPIIDALEREDLGTAREKLSMVVRRRTEDMGPSLISSAAIETVAEGLVDGVLSPVFYFTIFGVTGAFFYRVANTFDSNIAYKDSRNFGFGRFAAILDTVLNYLPARLAAFIIYIASSISGIPPVSYDLMANARIPDSANAGWPMGAMSNCLGVRLEKPGEYVINDTFPHPGVNDVRKALRLFTISSLISLFIFSIPVMIFLYTVL